MLTQDQQVFEQIKKAKNILISFSKTWNGDAIASSLALFLFLKKIGKNVDIAADQFQDECSFITEQEKNFSFLPAYEQIKDSIDGTCKFVISLNTDKGEVKQVKYKIEKNSLDFIIIPKSGFFTPEDISSSSSGFKYDLIIILDSADLESLGKIYEDNTDFFYKTPIINIDHHSDNEEFGQINFIELTAVSTSEILFSLFEGYSREFIDNDVATCLLAGIICKTKSFKTPNITPHTLLATSQLISMGARREEIVNKFYRSRSLNVLKLWGRVLARLSGELNNKLVWSTLSKDDFIRTKSNENDLKDVIDELMVNIPEAQVIVIFYENNKLLDDKKEGFSTNVIVYSAKNTNSMSLINEFNPSGSKRISRAIVEKSVKEVEEEIVKLIKDKLEKLQV